MESVNSKNQSRKRLISVVMPVYNGEDVIRASVESILSQKYPNFELIIVDDGSTDKTREVIKSFDDRRIRYFYQENSGAPAGPKNKGVLASRGDFICFCDHDDLYYPEKLEKQLEAFEKLKGKDVGIIISSADIIDGRGKKINQNSAPFEGFLPPKESLNLLLKGDFITACSALFPREVVDEVGLLDERLKGVEEYELWMKIAKNHGIFAIKKPLCAWRYLPNSMSADKSRLYIETDKIFDKLEPSNEVNVGHGKNLMRIIVSLVLDKRFQDADKYVKKALEYPLSSKAKALLKIHRTSPIVSFCLLKILDKMGFVSL